MYLLLSVPRANHFPALLLHTDFNQNFAISSFTLAFVRFICGCPQDSRSSTLLISFKILIIKEVGKQIIFLYYDS
jgi:hypothetical protein